MFFVTSAFSYTPQYLDSEKTKPLRWDQKVIKISISKSLLESPNNLKTNKDIFKVVQESLNQWQNVSNIKFQLEVSDELSVSQAGKVGDGISLITIAQTPENILLFGDKANEVSALTQIFYDKNGIISEADIVLNPIHLFSTDGTFGTFDLQATLTHEVGHLLGLDHSKIIGSTMHTHQGKNGIYDLPGFNSRTISEDDTAGIISLYGKKSDNQKCCGAIDGRLTNVNEVNLSEYHIWAEEIETGKVVAGVLSNSKGNFYLEGLDKGSYRLYAQPIYKGSLYSIITLGEFDIETDSTVNLEEEVDIKLKRFEAKYVGFNGQLSTIAVPVNQGKKFLIYIGGKNFSAEDIEITINSPYFIIDEKSLTEHKYQKDVSVVSFELELSENTPFGEYSIQVKNQRENTSYIVGGITVGKLVNPWSI